jgi:hypothetical protein
MQKFGKLIFLALVFGSLVGCGSDDNDGVEGFSGEVDNNTTNSTTVTSSNLPELNGYFALQVGADVFPEPNRHIFGDWWDSASIETHSVRFSSLNSADKNAYEEEVKEEFPDILTIGQSGVYHNVAYYQGNLIGDASVEIVNDAPDSYSVIKAVDLILPIPVFINKVDGGVFSNGHIFPELIGFPITEVITTIHYGYFGSPNLQTYKIKLAAAGFEPTNGKNDHNVWTKVVTDGDVTYTYTFEHDRILLDATWITNPLDDIFTGFGLDGIVDYQIPAFGTIAGITNHWLGNWTNINKFARWKVSVK